jgi:hypothetical protein
MRIRTTLTCLAFLLVAGPAFAGADLAGLLKEASFRQSWDKLFVGEDSVPGWIETFAQTSNGVVTPSTDVTIGGQTFIHATLCEPHDCGNNQLNVVFTETGDDAWALLVEHPDGGTTVRLFGDPGTATAAALKQMAGE